MEPITTAASILLSKIVMDKFYEGVSSKLGEQLVEKAIVTPVMKLGELIWSKCLQLVGNNQKAEQLLQAATTGNEAAQQNLTIGVNQVLENADEPLKGEIKELADQINQYFTIGEMNGGEVWNVFGGKAEKNEYSGDNATVYKDSTINNYYGDKPG